MTFNELRDKLFHNYEAGAISDEQVVQIIELASKYLNLKTITNYAKSNGISYNGASKRSVIKVSIDSVTFLVDNK